MRIRVNGRWLFFEVDGFKSSGATGKRSECPTVVALHGGPGIDHADLRRGLSPLSKYAQVLYLDHLGNGRSERASHELWNLERWGDDVRAFCEALDVAQPIVFGNSFGGMVALAYATRYPTHAAKLILCATAARFERAAALEQFARLGGKEAALVAERFFTDPDGVAFDDYVRVCLPLYRMHPASPGGHESIVHLDVARHFVRGEWSTFDFRAQLAAIECPTLVLAGEQDPVFPISCSETLASGIRPDLVRFERFIDCGHAVMNDANERAHAAIEAFILREPAVSPQTMPMPRGPG